MVTPSFELNSESWMPNSDFFQFVTELTEVKRKSFQIYLPVTPIGYAQHSPENQQNWQKLAQEMTSSA